MAICVLVRVVVLVQLLLLSVLTAKHDIIRYARHWLVLNFEITVAVINQFKVV